MNGPLSSHLSTTDLNSLADGEVSAEQLDSIQEHLSGCPSCTASALSQTLLKSATARAGQRYTPPQLLREQLQRQTAAEMSRQIFGQDLSRQPAASEFQSASRVARVGWAVAAAVLLLACAGILIQRGAERIQIASVKSATEYAAFVTEVSDQHIASLAAMTPPQVLSSDRHTVKPWFQGKLPFSFNLPEVLPAGTTLDGANLSYIHGQPVAQLLYSVGRHRVSVFVSAREDAAPAILANHRSAEHAGFHVMACNTNALEVVGVSDVDPARLSDLVTAIQRSQP